MSEHAFPCLCGGTYGCVTDSRTTPAGEMRRRRECKDCGGRVTTYERVADKYEPALATMPVKPRQHPMYLDPMWGTKARRNEEIARRVAAGERQADVAADFELSRSRIAAIVRRTPTDSQPEPTEAP